MGITAVGYNQNTSSYFNKVHDTGRQAPKTDVVTPSVEDTQRINTIPIQANAAPPMQENFAGEKYASKEFREDFLAGTTEKSKTEEVQKGRKNDYYEEMFENTADGVREAWEEAEKKTGVNGYGMDKSGKLSHITQVMLKRLLGGNRGSANVLGTSAIDTFRFAKEALEKLENPLMKSNDPGILKLEEDEKEFYREFIKNLEELIKKGADAEEDTTGKANQDTKEPEEETNTYSEIVVNSDGSRTLIITKVIGDMKTTMSVKISEETDMTNEQEEISKQNDKNETDGMSKGDADAGEVNMISMGTMQTG